MNDFYPCLNDCMFDEYEILSLKFEKIIYQKMIFVLRLMIAIIIELLFICLIWYLIYKLVLKKTKLFIDMYS